MPRTKKAPTTTLQKKQTSFSALKNQAKSILDEQKDATKNQVEYKEEIENVKKKYTELREKLDGLGLLDKTIEDLELECSTISSTISNSTLKSNKTRSRVLRSASFHGAGGFDEGYTTGESSGSTNSGTATKAGRPSRSRVKTTLKSSSKLGLSRSESRTGQKERLSRTRGTFVTPQIRPVAANSGTITPKCKMNAPLICMRRPKGGERVWSNQGSPLLVNAASEATPNINIPIGNDVISLLPIRGLVSRSEVPEMSPNTFKQVSILRDNLIRVCNIAAQNSQD